MKAEKKKKGSRKGGLLACFEAPVVADEHVVLQAEKQRRKATSFSGFLLASFPSLTPSSSSWSSLPDGEGKPRRGEGSGKRKRYSPRLIAKIIRSAVFVTSLKTRSAKAWGYAKQLSPPPEVAGAPLAADGRAWDEDEPSSEAAFSSSSLSSSSSASSGLSTITSSSQPPLAQTGKAPEGKTAPSCPRRERTSGSGGGDSASMGLCLVVLLVLFVLVFWGRLCAIIWTSACLCFVLGRDRSEGTKERKEPPRSLQAGGGSIRRETAEEWQKRRVVLAGLLDRRRRP